jgi:hypothetical protein
MRPEYVLRFGREAFPGSNAACLGFHVAAVISEIERTISGLIWYAADVKSTGYQFPYGSILGGQPVCVGSSKQLISMASAVDQFERGVFAAVSVAHSIPTFREGGLWMEDAADADLGDAFVEVRAFDASYIEVAVARDEVAPHLVARLRSLVHEAGILSFLK